ncbi:DsbA family oxidoreductase [Paenibacillus yanchengensis]|uniref:DsbA family oxidoreductase n=1 Tax=Paenibacillus yanchengensis TaxID=2035833 RepID=A0ABW4YQD0_9BACL
MKIEVWSDYVCPFCYIGKKRLDQALEQFAHKDNVTVTLRSFELDPTADSSLKQKTHESLATKYGMTLDKAVEMSANIKEQAAAIGLQFNFEDMLVINTFDAHRLAQFAEEQGKGMELGERLLKAYFTDNDNLADYAVLANLAAEVGLDREAALQVLESNRFADLVQQQEAEASQLGVRGVPFFVFNRKYAISGAQPPEVFLETLQKVWEEEQQ